MYNRYYSLQFTVYSWQLLATFPWWLHWLHVSTRNGCSSAEIQDSQKTAAPIGVRQAVYGSRRLGCKNRLGCFSNTNQWMVNVVQRRRSTVDGGRGTVDGR